MRTPIRLSVAWLAVALFSIVVASFAVGSVRSRVTNVPTVLGSGAELGARARPSTEVTPSTIGTGTTQPTTSLATTTPVQPTTTLGSVPPTTRAVQPSGTSPTTTTSTPPVTTTGSTTHTFDTVAGSIQVVVVGETVNFGGAFPKPGWRVELKKSGPQTVEVHFERNDSEEEEDDVEFKAWIDHGELRTEISEND